MPRRRTLIVVAALLWVCAPSGSHALCTAAQVIQSVSGCPGGAAPCVINQPISIDAGGCVLDFGNRAVIVNSPITVGIQTLTLRGASVQINTGNGNSGLIDARAIGTTVSDSVGGGVLIETTGDVGASGSGRSFFLSGTSRGGFLQIDADGDVVIQTRIDSEGSRGFAAGGTIEIRSSRNILLGANADVSVRGGFDSSGGGEVLLNAKGDIIVLAEIDASGSDGGAIDIFAGAAVTVNDLISDGTGDAGSGGCIAIDAGTDVTVNGSIRANGTTGEFQSGGCGGVICVDSTFGDVTFTINGSLIATGARPDGGGGLVASIAGGSFSAFGPIDIRGPTGETCGGDLCIEAGVDVTLSTAAPVDASGGDSGGEIDLGAGRNVTTFGILDASGRQRGSAGGLVVLESGLRGSGDGDIVVGANIDASSSSTCSPDLGCGDGGTVDMVGCDVTINQGVTLNASGPFAGDNLITARRNLEVRGNLLADGTAAEGSDGTNDLSFIEGRTPITTGTIDPPASLNERIACTGEPGDPLFCLLPCPSCGDDVTEYPEACDPGPGASMEDCGTCSLLCETLPIAGCGDQLVCTQDSCDPLIGCIQLPVLGPCTEPPTPTPTITGTPPTSTPTPSNTPTRTITSTPTSTPLSTATSTATLSHTPTSSATASETPARPACPGDCNGDGQVTVNELISAVNISLGNRSVDTCPNADLNGNGQVAINELISAVNAALDGC